MDEVIPLTQAQLQDLPHPSCVDPGAILSGQRCGNRIVVLLEPVTASSDEMACRRRRILQVVRDISRNMPLHTPPGQ